MKLGQKSLYTVIALSVAVVGIAGWLLITDSKPPISNGKPLVHDEDPYADWSYYTSKLGGFGFRHPEILDFTAWRGEEVVDRYNVSGYEDKIRFITKSNPDITTNNFGFIMNITTTKPEAGSLETYLRGTTEKLDNGMTLWLEKRSTTSTCPAIRIGGDASFSEQLKNGKYLSVIGTFCWADNVTTDYTYEQQIHGIEWETAVAIIKSIKQ